MDLLIKSDLYRYQGRTDFKSFIRCFYREQGFRYSFFLRKSASHKKLSILGIIYRIFYTKYGFKFGYQIPKQVKLGKGLEIKHWGYIVVNSAAVIGDNCTILPGVTLGQTNRGKTAGAPVIGNKVWLGPGCAVVGNVKVGDNVLISANAFVNFDVPDNSVVIGNPATIISKLNATEGYITNIFES